MFCNGKGSNPILRRKKLNRARKFEIFKKLGEIISVLYYMSIHIDKLGRLGILNKIVYDGSDSEVKIG